MTSENKSLEKKNFLRDFLLWDFTIKKLVKTSAAIWAKHENKIVDSIAKCFPETKFLTRWSVAERILTLLQHLNPRVENVIKQLVRTYAFIEIWSTREVWRARKMRKSCSRRHCTEASHIDMLILAACRKFVTMALVKRPSVSWVSYISVVGWTPIRSSRSSFFLNM